MSNVFQRDFFETKKVKTTSIVSFGLKPLVKVHGQDTLFTLWDGEGKTELAGGANDDARRTYITFCVSIINNLMVAAKKGLPNGVWTSDTRVDDFVLSPTVINGLLISLRHAVGAGVSIEQDNLGSCFASLSPAELKSFKSSQYTVLGKKLYDERLARAAPARS